jgi:hypothetical protein
LSAFRIDPTRAAQIEACLRAEEGREAGGTDKGGERLLGKGHLAAKLEGAPEIIFGQVPFVDSDFLSQVVEGLKGSSKG